MKQILIALWQFVRLNVTGIVTEGHEIDVGATPETFCIFELWRILGQMRRIKSLHESCPLHHTGCSAAADDIDVISLRLVLAEHPTRDVFRIAAEEIDLDEGILFFKTFFQWAHDLIDNQPGVKGNFALLLAPSTRSFWRSADFTKATSSTVALQDRC